MDDPLFLWLAGLLILSLALVLLEVFIPSGGILGAAAFLCAIVAVIVGFRIGAATGLAVLGLVAVSTPTLMWLAIRIFPMTPMGRGLILGPGDDENLQQREISRRQESEALSALVGARGRAVTDLRPGGIIVIDGEEVEAFAERGMISAGSEVEVTRVLGRQIRVRTVA